MACGGHWGDSLFLFYLRLAATAPNQQQGQSNLGDEKPGASSATARLAQSVERKARNLVVVGSSPTVGVYMFRPEVLFFNWLVSSAAPLEMHAKIQIASSTRDTQTGNIQTQNLPTSSNLS